MRSIILAAAAVACGSACWNIANAAEALNVNQVGNVGIGLADPSAPLHVYRDDSTLEFLYLQSNAAGGPQDRPMMYLVNNGGIRFQFDNPILGTSWRFQAATANQDNFEITKVGTGVIEMRLDHSGNLNIRGTLSQNSDVNSKRDIEPINGYAVLERLDELPLSEWSYRADPEGVRHLGPMAQDFHAAFGLGANDTSISPGDMAGVSLAAVKTLYERNIELEKRVATLEAMLTQLLLPAAKEGP